MMARNSGAKCQYGSCRNGQHQGYEPYCYLHAGMSAAHIATAEYYDPDYWESLVTPPKPPTDGLAVQVQAEWAQFTSHHQALMESVSKWRDSKSIDDETTPEKAIANQETNRQEIRQHMIDSGIPSNDIVELKFSGLRRGVRGRFFAGYEHTTLGVYDEQGRLTVIDPAVSALSPVRSSNKRLQDNRILYKNSDQPVDHTFGSGKTMYGDMPLVCSQEEYMNNPDFSFKSVVRTA